VTGAEDGALTRPEKQYRLALWGHALLSFAFLVTYATRGSGEIGYIPNSIGKDALFVVVSILAAIHVRRHGWLVVVIALGYGGLILGQATALIWGGFGDQELVFFEVPSAVVLFGWMAIDVALTAFLLWMWFRAERARWELQYLHPLAFLSLTALGEVLIKGRREVVPPLEIAHNVDRYLAGLEARTKWRIPAALAVLSPLRALRPPTRERILENLFIRDVGHRRLPAALRRLVQAMIRLASQMTYLGYYGDTRSWEDIKYKPYSARHDPKSPPAPPEHIAPPLKTLAAPPRRPDYDAIVIGSGAAGGILAYRWAEAGRRVLVLERGPHVDPRDFTENEVDQYLRLYNEGALQIATDFRLSVLQGMCVGGGTTVNNALCLDPPDAVLAGWAQRGIDPRGLRQAIADVRSWLRVAPITDSAFSEAARRFADAAQRLPLPGTVELMEANILSSCRGCGYCNIGCPFGAKVSMLDGVLPWGQQQFGDRLQVLPLFEATRIVYEGDRAIAVEGVHDRRETVHLPAAEIIVAAGAVHSSYLLQRSGLAPGRAGNGLHFNINSPLTAEFPDPVETFAGIQMSHSYARDGDVPPYLIETWFNPPATQALAMPGWFGRHFENMQRYAHMASGGALTGTTTPGAVRRTRSGPAIDYKPSKADLGRIVDGLKVTGAIFLEAGAERVMPATYLWHEFRPGDSLAVLDRYVKDNADLQLTSAHPQGGNPVGERDAGAVVGPDFLVHGFKNLYLCDASAFPSSVGVNPQLTVMGLAQYAARQALGAAGPAPLAVAA
jgi:choline dehydrogenase-like flavoprotein